MITLYVKFHFRDTLTKWCKEITDRDDWTFSLTDFLISEREQAQWRTEGLGTDLLSVQNAIVIFNVSFFLYKENAYFSVVLLN